MKALSPDLDQRNFFLRELLLNSYECQRRNDIASLKTSQVKPALN